MPIEWKKIAFDKMPPADSRPKVRQALSLCNSSYLHISEPGSLIKKQGELSSTLLETTRVQLEELQNKAFDDLDVWSNRTGIPSQLLAAAQWTVDGICLHPCFSDYRPLLEHPNVDSKEFWFSIYSHRRTLDLKIFAGSSGFDIECRGRPISMDFNAPQFASELEFWLAFVNARAIRGLMFSVYNGARMMNIGELCAWSNLAKCINPKSERN